MSETVAVFMRSLLSWCVVGVSLCATAQARAAAPLHIEYSRAAGAEECPDEATFRAEVELAAGKLVDDVGAELVRVAFARTSAGYRATVEHVAGDKHDPPIERTNASCRDLALDVATSVSLFVPDAPASPAASSSSNPSTPPAPAPTSSDPPQKVQSLPPAQPPIVPEQSVVIVVPIVDVTISLQALALMSVGFSANVGPGVSIGGEVRGEVFSLGVEARALFPSGVVASEVLPGATSSRPVQLDISQFSGLLVPCVNWRYFQGCGAVLIGALHEKAKGAEGTGLDFALGPRITAALPLGERFELRGMAEVLFVPKSNTATYDLGADPANTRWVESEISGFFGLGFGVKFK